MVSCQKRKGSGGKQKPWAVRLLDKNFTRISCLRAFQRASAIGSLCQNPSMIDKMLHLRIIFYGLPTHKYKS